MIIEIIKCFFLSWFITRLTPIRSIFSAFFIGMVDYLPKTEKMQNLWLKIAANVLETIVCLKCVSFWITLIITGNIFTAAFVCFCGTWYNQLLKKKETEWRIN